MIVGNFLHSFIKFAGPFLKNLNPSLFQNVILGMLALLVPVGVGILSFFFKERSKGNIASNLELLILLKTVLKADKIVIFSFISLFLLSLYDVNIFCRILGISFFGFYVVWMLSTPFKNIWKWFLENTKDFSITFLRKLDVRKNKNTILSSWQALWLGDGQKENERDFTKIFISHIDDAVIKYKKFGLAVELSHTYVENIEKRDVFSISEILPKVFAWNEIFWNEQHFLKSHGTEKRIQNFFSQKDFPTFRNWALKIYKKTYSKRDPFWNWNYFGREFFQAITKTLLKDVYGPYELFPAFKVHIDETMEKLNKIKDEKEKQKYDSYITGLFARFCPIFFDETGRGHSNYESWENSFPAEWKISMANTKSGISRVILHEFLQWSRDRMFKSDKKPYFDKSLTEVINGLFPSVHSEMFTVFLILLFSNDVKSAIETSSNFYILDMSMSCMASVNESRESRDKNHSEMMEKIKSQKEETISIILNFFSNYWNELKIALNDDNKDKWKKAGKKDQEAMLKNAQVKKLEKLRDEIESEDIKKICHSNSSKEFRRIVFLELVNKLLLKKIKS